MSTLIHKISVVIVLILLISSCSPTKHLGENQVYLKANKIKIPSNVIANEELTPYVKQNHNTRFLLIFKIKQQQYLLFNDSNLARKNNKKKEQLRLKNTKRLEAGKDTNEFKPVWFARIKNKGEPPVVFDSSLTNETAYQFEKALFNIGYFNSEVQSTLKFNKDSSKVKVYYTATLGQQYHLNKISLMINDTNLLESIKVANKDNLLHKGNAFNSNLIESERNRFTREMRNQGYYYFAKEYVVYEIDSTIGDYKVDMNIVIKDPDAQLSNTHDSTQTAKHKKYTIGDITLNTSFNTNYPDSIQDSIHFDHLIFINLSRLRFNPHMFSDKLYFQKGDHYSESNQSKTYTRLSGLNNFKYMNISFTEAKQNTPVLNCNITMSPFPSQSVGVELEGTNSSGNLGVGGYLTYNHRNVFRNAENFKIRLKGGVEAQQTNSSSDKVNDGLNIFNTVEYGVETSLTFQELILPAFLKRQILRKFNQPKTGVGLNYNYQNRPDFERYLSSASFGYFFKRRNKKNNFNEVFFNPIDINFINIDKSDEFTARLDSLNNPLLDATYDNQLIAGSRVIQSWTNQASPKQTTFFLNRMQFEIAGNMLNWLNLGTAIDTIPGENPYSAIAGVRYAQFVKLQNDLRHTSKINRNQSMAYRFLIGAGLPYGNSKSLPYDRSFYGGGANDMRGWRARTLGPGSLSDSSSAKIGVDQVADIKLQISAEYRFNIINSVEGALFVDAGNIWLLRSDEERPNANFDINRFYKEIAISSGAGIRFNFGFLLIRLDWGAKIYDPSLPEGDRWVIGGSDYLHNYEINNPNQSYVYSVFNLGIGYPF